ncbi:MAG: tRNA lysidine(34) synthetase TilS, partial [Rubricoccaceae bacterium]|nr:tRNA lysidine(34) synthetase TilS [Rubricoccaceae bacterium]
PESENKQQAAREARYRFFNTVAEEVGADVVAVAHHADDQAETVLLNLFRGAGPNGLTGMLDSRPLFPSSDRILIRPLLDWRRREIEALALERRWRWREDSSNQLSGYRRNTLRNEIMPLVEKTFGDPATDQIVESAQAVREVMELGIHRVFDDHAETLQDGGRLPVEMLAGLSRFSRLAVLLHAVQMWLPNAPRRSGVLQQIDMLRDAQPGKRVVLPGGSVWRERDFLRFVKNPAVDADALSGILQITTLDSVPEQFNEADPFEEVVDSDVLSAELTLRRWKDGDRFQPLGLDGTKLVSDLLAERKVPPSAKDGQLVLCSGNKIIWAVGHRLAHEARITPQTRSASRIRWLPLESDAGVV